VALLPQSLSLVPDHRMASVLPNRVVWLAIGAGASALAAAAPALTGAGLHRPGRGRGLFRPLPAPLALQWYAIKAAFGRGAWIPPLAGALLGAFLTAGPLARAPSEHMRFYVTVFWAEAFLPWLAILMPARGALTTFPGLQARLECLPDYHRRQMGHMAVTLLLYHTSVALGFLLGGKLFWPEFPGMMTLGAVMPVFLFFSSLPLAAGTWLGRPWLGSLAGAAVWLVAFGLEHRLPWFLNPLFFLAEYEVKLHWHGLWPIAKLLFLGYGIAISSLALAIRPRTKASG